jgi:hypothetical protein
MNEDQIRTIVLETLTAALPMLRQDISAHTLRKLQRPEHPLDVDGLRSMLASFGKRCSNAR